MSLKKWNLRKPLPKKANENLSNYPEKIRPLLYYRDLKTPDQVEEYLNPLYDRDLHDPFLMLDMEKAVDRVLLAINNHEKIIIYGDYDADGVPGAAIIASFFKAINFDNFEVYIPDRHLESYGLNLVAIEKFKASQVNLIITVDCAVTNDKEIAVAEKSGINVIVTDHHLVPDQLPPAFAVVDAKRAGDPYPFKFLCGAAVAFKLVLAIMAKDRFGLKEGWEKWLLDLVAISTVSDMVPMIGENRVLTHFGLKVLRQTKRLGLRTLLQILKIKPNFVTEDDIGFMVGPRINAASRMSNVSQAYDLIMTEALAEAETISQHLEEKNSDRREYVEKILKEVDARCLAEEPAPVLVMGSPDWNPGVLGLTSSRLKDKYDRPVFLWSQSADGSIKGSGRSDGRVNLVELMKSLGEDFFVDVGGHKMAAGFTLASGKETELEHLLSASYLKLRSQGEGDEISVDSELALDDINWGLSVWIEKLGPYGVENPKPVFLLKEVEIFSVKAFGNGGIHLELSFRNSSGKKIDAIGFFTVTPAEKFDGVNGHIFHGAVLEPGQKIDLLANLEKSTFRNFPELRLRIVDIHPVK